MPSPELVIFDCDGVLLDNEVIAFQVLTETLAEYGIRLTVAEAMEQYLGISGASEIADIENRYRIKLKPDYAATKRARLTKLYETSLTAMPGIFELLDALPCKKCVASSSSPQRLELSLGQVGLYDRFAPNIYSAAQVKNGKPAPDLFLFAAEQMGVDSAACLVIEDSVPGVRAAKAAGMRVYGFTGGGHCDAGHGERLLNEGAASVFKMMDDLAKKLSNESEWGSER